MVYKRQRTRRKRQSALTLEPAARGKSKAPYSRVRYLHTPSTDLTPIYGALRNSALDQSARLGAMHDHQVKSFNELDARLANAEKFNELNKHRERAAGIHRDDNDDVDMSSTRRAPTSAEPMPAPTPAPTPPPTPAPPPVPPAPVPTPDATMRDAGAARRRDPDTSWSARLPVETLHTRAPRRSAHFDDAPSKRVRRAGGITDIARAGLVNHETTEQGKRSRVEPRLRDAPTEPMQLDARRPHAITPTQFQEIMGK